MQSALADGPLLLRPEAFAYRLLQDLAGTALGQILFGQLDSSRNFVTRQAFSTEGNYLLYCERCFGFTDYICHHKFTPLRIGYTEYSHFANGGRAVDHTLHLSRINVFPAGDDHVLEAVQDVEVTRIILLADIARTKESVAKRFCRFLSIIPIA